MIYNYCPVCGEKLLDKLAGDDGPTPFCPQCDKFWFPTFSDCVIVLVTNELKEIALVKMPYLSQKYESLISGYMKPGETAEAAAHREVQEELGISLTSLRYSGTYWFAKNETLMHGFIGTTVKQDFKISDELASAEWVPAKDAPQYMFPNNPGNAALAVYRNFIREIY